ncbi:MAG: acetyl-CoA acetyltransferase [Chloroflexi bacterium RBG_13_51_36]|nr:MAG: acetyl-CoA acetyltransferase [Chloroflexi bacterium RBG_13_51_36]
MQKEVVVVSGARTAIGAFGGALKDIGVVELGAAVIKEALKRAGLRPKSGEGFLSCCPDALKSDAVIELEKKYYDYDSSLHPVQVGEVIMGHVLQGGQGQNTARQACIYAGIPKETPAFTVNKVCASGLKAITLGAEAIMLGETDVVVAGGMECMSNTPYVLPKARWGYRMDVGARGEVIDLMVYDGLWEIFYGYHMGNTAEEIARRYGFTRQQQDEIGYLSHMRARKAIVDGLFKDEIVPFPIPQKKGEPVVFDTDERPMDTSMEKMAKLPPAFRKDGTVTAGNSSGINDAAAAVVLMSQEKARELGLKPMAKLRAWASGGTDPNYMGLGPIPAVRKVLKKTGLGNKDLDVVELNEAFAAQALGCMKELGWNSERVNPHGSGISMGHPIGCTGARIAVTIIYDMVHRNLHRGLETMCIGGGQGMAALWERP